MDNNNNPPTVTLQPSVVPILGRLLLRDVFTVSDPDPNSTVTRYQFRDNSPNAGQLLIGDSVQSANVWHEIPASLLNQVAYRGASAFARETISVRAYDGQFWSNVGTTFITTGNERPTIEVENGRVPADDLIRVDRFFTFNDPDNDPLQRLMIVDRRNNADGGRFVLRGEELAQATFHTLNAGELGDLFYRGAVNGGEEERIGLMGFDGYSWSELVEFQMATSSEPVVVGSTATLLTNQRRWIGARNADGSPFFFDVSDADGDPIQAYLFVDRRPNPDGGYFEYQGNRMPSATWFSVPAANIGQVFYVAGSTGPQSEEIGVQVYDGVEFSLVENSQVRTVLPPQIDGRDTEVQATHYLNFATGGTANTSGQVPDGTAILDFEGSDGSDISRFMFVDRRFNDNGGHFVFKGVRLPSAQWFAIDADELPDLEYRGGVFGPQSENISAIAFSNGTWSAPTTFSIDTLENRFRPVVNLFNVDAQVGTSQALEGMFNWSDADGDILSTVHLYDTGSAAASGYFAINGVRQPAQQWLSIPYTEISTVTYEMSDIANTEVVRMFVNDGRLTSTLQSATIRSVEKPVIDANDNDISVDTIERVPLSSLISQLDSGPSLRQFQVFDENDFFRSGRIELDGIDLQQGVVHTLTAAEFSRVVVKGAEADFGRQLDPVLVRGDNGVTGWTDWERINVNTDPVGGLALLSGTDIDDKNLSRPKFQITYSFIDGGNQSGGTRPAPNYPPLPSYYPPNATCETQVGIEALGTRALSQEQREAIREVFDGMETFANIEFIETAFTLDAADAEIVMGAWGPFDCLSASAYAYLPTSGDGRGNIQSDIWFNTANGDFDPLTPTDVSLGSFFRYTAAHEIGHALGMKHPFEGDPLLSIFNNFDYNTVMAYQHDSVHNPFEPYVDPDTGLDDFPSSYQLYDVEELQRIYGVNTEHNTNNNHYGNFFSGSYPHFISNDEQHQTTLFDAGGVDTLNYTNHLADETIDLREGAWSSINGVANSLRISYITQIENARGGAGNDNIRGNEVRNLLFGNDGDDVLRGGGDNDVLRGGRGGDTYVWSLGDGRDLIREEGNGVAGEIDVVEFYDPSGSIDSLEDDFTVRLFGNDLRIDLTLDQGGGQGTITLVDFTNPASQVELMRIHGLLGEQVGNDIDVTSFLSTATTTAQRYRVTDVVGANGGFLVAPV